jgi:hypothetical protein
VTASIRSALYQSWGSQVARTLFQRRCIVNPYSFHNIAWDYVGRAMDAYPQMFNLWVTKHVSGFNGTNRQLSRFQDDITNKCLCCGHKDKSSSHVTRCPNPGRWKIFRKTVDSLLDWMENTHSDIKLVECLETYLLAHGEGSMVDIAAPFPHLHWWAMELDKLGWDNLLEGRIRREILPLQARSMQRQGSQWHIKSWATEFIHQLLGITHKQWLYHNARTHICLLDGKTESEHNSIMDQVGRFLFTDPSLLLPQHCHLLELDFEKLGTGPTTDRQYWLANLESAVNAFQSTVWPPTSPSLTISPTSTHLGDPTRSATCRIIELS